MSKIFTFFLFLFSIFLRVNSFKFDLILFIVIYVIIIKNFCGFVWTNIRD